MKKQYINPAIEFHAAEMQTFMENVFSENEPDVKERGNDFEEEDFFNGRNFKDNNGMDIQRTLW